MSEKHSTCYLCNNDDLSIIHYGVRGNNNINVLKCKKCGLVQLSDFISNTDEYYQDSKMRTNQTLDMKKILVTAAPDDERRYQFSRRMIENKKVLDFGCGAGGYLKRIIDLSSVAYGVELEDIMREHLTNEGIKCFPSIDVAEKELESKVDVITLWHVLEHLEDPIEMLKRLKGLLAENGKIIIEVPNADDALITKYKCKAFEDFTYWECHLFLYTIETLKQIAARAGLECQFITQVQRYPLSNHLYWLSNNKPGGHMEWAGLSDDKLDFEYGRKLASLGIADTIIAILK
jgi:2-polyprenyl-3-methyl-5-hydroxy-6-metoxy-1,4-benzoquinol methylase